MKQDTKNPFADFMHDQIVNISKAGAYDAIAPRLKELDEQNKAFRKAINDILHEIANMDSSEVVKDPSLIIGKLRSICSETLTKNRPL